ncbi:MAG: 2-phosphosulfolactate phosphatase [Dehalococcoidia bacterium]
MLTRIDVAVLPSEAPLITSDACIVVDVLRATTTIAVLFARGLERLSVVDDIARARLIAAQAGALLMGEVDGLPPAGFDHGNSPVEAAALNLAGKAAVLFTTNGTTALCAIPPGAVTYAGALANASALARAVAAGHTHVTIVCAGNARARAFALEDFAAAGALVRALLEVAPSAVLGDAASLAARTPVEAIAASEHARRLEGIGLGEDVAFCGRLDTAACVPRVVASGPGYALLKDATGRP